MTIMNRTVDKANELARELTAYSGNPAKGVAFNLEELSIEMKTADILVNTTSIGFADSVGETPVPKELIRPNMIIYFWVYHETCQ